MGERIEGGRPTGLLIYLHGHASHPQDVAAAFREHRDDGWCRVCPAGPLAVDGGRAWFDAGARGVDGASLGEAVDLVTTVVRTAASELDLTLDRVVLGGFSQGAATALAAAASIAEPLGGLLLHAGFVPEVFGEELAIGSISAPAVLVQHPSADEVVPPAMGNDVAALLKDAPGVGDVELQMLPGVHEVSDAMTDAALRWLSER